MGPGNKRKYGIIQLIAKFDHPYLLQHLQELNVENKILFIIKSPIPQTQFHKFQIFGG
jgi:hypothetical protein